MTVVVDAMGGDHAPQAIVAGARLAAESSDLDIVLVGREEVLRQHGADHPGLRIHHASEVVGMDEHPAEAMRKKRDNSIAAGFRLVKQTPGAAFVSAGSTGAVMAGALFNLKRIPGVERPAIAGVVPTATGRCVMADVGANVDCKPHQIEQFAVLACRYAQLVLGVERPRLGILNIGTEDAKGNEQVRETRALLAALPDVDFVGNVEPGGVYAGAADVVATDGFAGNIFLKSSEAMAQILQDAVRDNLGADVPPALAETLARFDPHDSRYAGAPLLGVNGPTLIVHGSAEAETIRDAIQVAHEVAASGYVGHLRSHYQPEDTP